MQRSFIQRFFFVAGCILSFSVMGLVFNTSPAQKAYAAEMGEICAECHEQAVAYFLDSYHARKWRGKELAQECESCHGSTARHLEDPSKETILSFGEKSKKSAEEQSAVCLNCHEEASHLTFWDMGQHKQHDVACVSCHSVHAQSPEVHQPETCFGCHRRIRLLANKVSHHPVIEGKVQCSDCHNPHGALGHGMIKEDNVNQLCYRCHAEKRGPFIWEHPPVEENCAICHNPHGSRHENLIVEKIPNLCQDCHDFSRHPGTPYDNKTGFLGSGPTNRFFGRSCVNCHGMIHGSVAPENPSNTLNSGRFFTR